MNNNNTFNVNSENQVGGITAGIVNIINEAQIKLSEEAKQKITDLLENKNNIVHVSLQEGGSSNLTALSENIKNFLIKEGYKNVQGVNTIMGFSPFGGIEIEKKSDDTFVIFIGALQ